MDIEKNLGNMIVVGMHVNKRRMQHAYVRKRKKEKKKLKEQRENEEGPTQSPQAGGREAYQWQGLRQKIPFSQRTV